MHATEVTLFAITFKSVHHVGHVGGVQDEFVIGHVATDHSLKSCLREQVNSITVEDQAAATWVSTYDWVAYVELILAIFAVLLFDWFTRLLKIVEVNVSQLFTVDNAAYQITTEETTNIETNISLRSLFTFIKDFRLKNIFKVNLLLFI